MWPNEFMQPDRLQWLWAIVVILLLYVVLVWLRSSSRQQQVRTTGSGRLDLVIPRERPWKRHLAVLLAILSLGSLIMAYARPKGTVDEPRDRATIVVVIDVSKSMVATDVSPTRLAAAQEASKQFVDLLPPRFNVTLVTFAATARLVVPPTTDRTAVKNAIDGLQLAPSTAIGEGIMAGLDSLALVPPDPAHPDDVPPASMVLLSDGATNLGVPSRTAAERAKQMDVPVFTIAYGTPGGYIEDKGRREPVPVDTQELARVAQISGGKAWEARSKQELGDVYKNISSVIGYQKVDKETTSEFVWTALVCGILASLSVISIAARWP